MRPIGALITSMMLFVSLIVLLDLSRKIREFDRDIVSQMKTVSNLTNAIRADLATNDILMEKQIADSRASQRISADSRAEILARIIQDQTDSRREFAILIQQFNSKAADRITRTEILEWREKFKALLPEVPEVPSINAPKP